MSNLVIKGVGEDGQFVEATHTSPLVVYDLNEQKPVAGPFADLVGASQAMVEINDHVPHSVDQVALLAIQMRVGHGIEDLLPRGQDGDLLRDAIARRMAELQLKLEAKFAESMEKFRNDRGSAPHAAPKAVEPAAIREVLEYAVFCEDGGYSDTHVRRELQKAGVDADSAFEVVSALQKGGMLRVVSDFGDSPQHADALAALQAYTYEGFKGTKEAEARQALIASQGSVPSP